MSTEKQAPQYPMHLPQTSLPMRAGLAENEPKWVKKWLDEDLYGQMREARKDAPVYIVHLGPPYANGHFHMGHVLTYVLKDMIVRSKFMAGFDSPYAPGWDCHGLPIEWKIEQELRAGGKTKADVTKAELRAKCRAYAQGFVDIQKSEWQRFGALGDWERPYLTMAKPNEAGIVRALGELVQKGFVYKALRCTLWSWAEETAMAEAEVEYEDRVSTAVYVALPIIGRENEHLVIWTTTPWTLPGNRAVAVNAGESYAPVTLNDGRKVWVEFQDLLQGFMQILNKAGLVDEHDPKVGQYVMGKDLVGLEYEHPLYAGLTGKVWHGDHVTTESGTGMVHTAPAHGVEDFYLLDKVEGMDLRSPIDGKGHYEGWVDAYEADGTTYALPEGLTLAGRFFESAQADILTALGGKMLHSAAYPHRDTVSWRSKKKLIYRTTEQWFVALDKEMPSLGGKTLRGASLDRIYGYDDTKGVEWVPEYGANRIGSMIENRPDWCISRQRAWGVPITLFLNKADGSLVNDPAVWDHVANLVEAEGIDAWDTRLEGGRKAELFPAGWLETRGVTADDFEAVTDILDVWFDSGTTWRHVLKADSAPGQRFDRKGDGKRPADLYQEGSDQHRGWFHSSLLTSVALTGDAPYESVVTSGFVVDGDGRKFSKSLGNGVEPRALLDKFGMDIIRLWVASSDYSEDIRYSPVIMQNMADAYRKFRNVFRWILGNLHGYQAINIAHVDLPELEQYVLHQLAKTLEEVRGHYEGFAFHKAYRALYQFVETTLSNLYFEARKDTLYCDAANSPERMACQHVLEQVLRALLTHLAPIMPFTTEEVWGVLNTEVLAKADAGSVHLLTYHEALPTWRRDEAFEARWEKLLAVRAEVNLALEGIRTQGQIGASADAAVMASMSAVDAGLVRLLTTTSLVTAGDSLSVAKHGGEKCPRCWRYWDKLAESGVCLRCEDALHTHQQAA